MMRVQRGELLLSTVLVREKPPPWSGGEGGGKNRKFGKRKEPFSRDGCRVLSLEATPGFEPGNQGFADPCLTTWLCRRVFLFYAGVGGGNTYFRGVSGGGGRCSTGGPFYRWICPSAAPAGWCSGNEQLGRGSNPLPPPWQGGALPDELRPLMVQSGPETGLFLVPPVGIEPTTRGFSVLCSTN